MRVNKTERINQWRNMLIGRLVVERAQDLSNAELRRCLENCVAPRQCIVMARLLRLYKLLTIADIQTT